MLQVALLSQEFRLDEIYCVELLVYASEEVSKWCMVSVLCVASLSTNWHSAISIQGLQACSVCASWHMCGLQSTSPE